MPANHEITFVCFGIAKVQCQKLNNIGYFISLSYMPMHGLLKRIYAKKYKSKKNQNALYMIASGSSRRCRSYRMYLECDSPHQAVMIVCELKWFFHILNRHKYVDIYVILQCFSHTTCNILCYSWYMCRYNVVRPSQGIHVSMYAH